MPIEKREHFDQSFFKNFAQIPWEVSDYYQEIKESFEELEIIFNSNEFNQTFQWQALILRNPQGMSVARAVVCWPKNKQVTFAAVGYFSAKQNLMNIDELWDEMTKIAKSWGATELRGPIQGHFWNSYRASIGVHFPLFGEYRSPEYYHQYWLRASFQKFNQWFSYKVPVKAQLEYHENLKKRLRADSHLSEVVLRPLDLKNWEQELKHFFLLLSESYKKMPDFVSIPWPHFWELSKDLRYLLNPQMCRFAIYRGEIVGFLVAMRSPMRALLWAKKTKFKCRKIPGAATLISYLAIIWAKLFPGEYIIPYVGKVERKGLPKLHGLLIDMSILTCRMAISQGQEYIYPVLLAQGSPALKAIPENSREIYSEHILYHKTID